MKQVSRYISIKPGLIQGNKRLPFTEKIEQNSNKFEINSLKKTEELLKSAFVNKKFSNYRWFN